MDITLCVGTYGGEQWVDMAHERPIRSALQAGVPFVHVHGRTLCEARNACLAAVQTEWLVYVDADDELHRRYFERIATGTADIRAPAVQYIRPENMEAPYVPRVVGHEHACIGDCLDEGNWIVIGAAARTHLLRDVGGFRDYPMYEDWDLWVRCWKVGATIEQIPAAVYRAYVRPDSRNRGPNHLQRLETHQSIARANGLKVPA